MSPSSATLQTLCKRYGPGRLPMAETHAIGAGYAAATAAVFAATVYAGATLFVTSLGPAVSPAFDIFLAGLALVLFLPAAFVTAVVGWSTLSPESPVTGIFVGFAGVFATYGVALVLFGVPLTVLEALTGTDPLRTAVFSWGLVYFAFVETWWVTIPTGCVSGFVYVTVVRQEY